MSKEETIEIVKEFIGLQEIHSNNNYAKRTILSVYQEAIKGLLDLYLKEKEINKELKKDKKVLVKNYDKVLGNFISNDKIKEKQEKLPHWLTEEEVRGIKFFVNELLEGDK